MKLPPSGISTQRKIDISEIKRRCVNHADRKPITIDAVKRLSFPNLSPKRFRKDRFYRSEALRLSTPLNVRYIKFRYGTEAFANFSSISRCR